MKHVVATLFVLSSMVQLGCGSSQVKKDQAFDPGLCVAQAAYDRGHADGLAEHEMSSQLTSRCPADSAEAAAERYRDGYLAGNQQRLKEVQSRQEQWLKMEATTQKSAPAMAANPKKYFCRLDVFGRFYEAYGPNQLEASQSTQEACRAQQGKNTIFCDRPVCRLNH